MEMPNLKPRFPLREWFGKFSAWYIYECDRKTHIIHSDSLELFFATFPKKTGVEQFTSTDVIDFVELQMKGNNVSQKAVEMKVVAINLFWKYLVDFQRLPGLFNIAKVYRRQAVTPTEIKKRNSLSIVETLRLVDCIDDVKVKHEVLDLICGERVIFAKHTPRHEPFKQGALKAGMPWVGPDWLKTKINNRLQTELLKKYIEQVRAQLPERPTQYGSFTQGSPSHLEVEVLQDHQSLLQWYRSQNPQPPCEPPPVECLPELPELSLADQSGPHS